MVQPEQALREFTWSSVPAYLEHPRARPPWLRVDRLLGECHIAQDTRAGRREFERRTEACRQSAKGKDWKPIQEGWCLGDEEFRRELLQQMSSRMGAYHGGSEKWETAEAKAEALIHAALSQSKRRREDLGKMRKGDPWKAALAARLRRETTMTIKWIAERLQMGSWTYLTNRLYWVRRDVNRSDKAQILCY